jgi:hypothetical protein
LAEGEELSSNPLRAFFNDLRTTQIAVDVDWRILRLFSQDFMRWQSRPCEPNRSLQAAVRLEALCKSRREVYRLFASPQAGN